MSEYRRFIAYFYEYIDGKKQKNAGFVKVELRNGVWRLLLRLTTLPQPAPPIQVYGFVRESRYLLGFPLGTIRPVREVAEEWAFRADAPVGHDKYRLGDLAGILAESGDGRRFATVWDEEGFTPERFVLQLPETQPRTEEGNLPASPEPSGAREENSSEGLEPSGAGTKNFSEGLEPSGAGEENSSEGLEPSGAGTENFSEGLEPSGAGTENFSEELEPAVMEEGNSPDYEIESSAKEAGHPDNGTEVSDSEAENPDNGVSYSGAKNPDNGASYSEAENPDNGASYSEAENPDNGASYSEAENPDNGASCSEAENFDNETNGSDSGAAVSEDKKKRTEPAGAETSGKPISAAEAKTTLEELLCRRAHFQPFADDEIGNCVMILPCDIVRLQQENWKVGRSSFLQHGFYLYRHLLLGVSKDGTYLLGVPGIKNPQETYMAQMFGYDRFKASARRSCGQIFGYWCRELQQA